MNIEEAIEPETGTGSHRSASLARRAKASLRIGRRQLLVGGFFGALGTSLVLYAVDGQSQTSRQAHETASDMRPPVALDGDGYQIRAEGKRSAILLCAPDGKPVQRFRGYQVDDAAFIGGQARLTQVADGSDAILVEYEQPVGMIGRVRALFIPRGARMEVRFELRGFDGTPEDGKMLRETVDAPPVVETVHGVAPWQRDARGGIPFQKDSRFVFVQEHDRLSLAICVERTQTHWRGDAFLYLPPTRTEGEAAIASAVLFLGEESRPGVLDARAFAEPLALELITDQPFNIWTSPDVPLPVQVVVYNGRGARPVVVSWTARDFDGDIVAQNRLELDVAPGSTREIVVPVAMEERGIAFLEVTARSGRDSVYARTNVAVLPPHEYGLAEDRDMFGIAADYLHDSPHERALLKRIGVRRSRHTHFTAQELDEYGFTQHRLRTPPSPDAFDDDPGALERYVSEELDYTTNVGSSYYELANEWNLKGDGAFSGDGAKKYVDKWVRAFRRELRKRDSDIKLIAVGLAGMDVPYAIAMFRAGLAKYVDAFNLHPGRGNFTPDYSPDAASIRKGKDRTWNFYGAVRQARELIDKLADGEMELWLTEVYAPTRPNAWWDDTYRHAAENVVLSAALAMSLDVTSMMWFQLYDNIKSNPYGTSPGNREYHFGLILRDLSPKPSLLAYAAAAEHLDGARFSRWLSFDDPHLRGMTFATPRGPLALLWNRADGYTLNTEGDRDGGFFPAPEPWVDTWKTKTEIALPAVSDEVTEIDVIGRSRTLAPVNGKVKVTLDGAVRMYYGLDTGALKALDPSEHGQRNGSAGAP